MSDPKIQRVPVGDREIAIRHRTGRGPGLMFLPGYASDMEGAKALALDAFAAERGVAMMRFDYSGTGESGGEFADGTLDRWMEDSLAVLDRMAAGPVILVGSSMGGWLALHLALNRPERVAALVGIAAAPDFTQWGYSESEMRQIAQTGMLEVDNPYGEEPYRTYRDFWNSGQAMRLLDGEIAIECPVRLIHGDSDEDVPLEIAGRVMERLRSSDVQLLTIKGGGHRLSAPHEIAAILATVRSLLESR